MHIQRVTSSERLRGYSTLHTRIVLFNELFYQLSSSRMGYIEVFYPPSAFYLLLAFLWIATLLSFRNRLSRIQPSTFYLNIGKSSLLIYMLHAAINHFIIEETDPQLNSFGYGVLVASLLVFFHFVSILHQHVKKHTLYKSCPIFVRKIFGI